ncbi:hypothetical protein [Spirosoma aerophilum]
MPGIYLISLFFILTESVLVADSLWQQSDSYLPHSSDWLLLLSVGVLLLWLKQRPPRSSAALLSSMP